MVYVKTVFYYNILNRIEKEAVFLQRTGSNCTEGGSTHLIYCVKKLADFAGKLRRPFCLQVKTYTETSADSLIEMTIETAVPSSGALSIFSSLPQKCFSLRLIFFIPTL